MRSAGINFGIPQCEWNIEVDEDGSNPRCWNPVTGEELGGGGGGIPTCKAEVKAISNDNEIEIAAGTLNLSFFTTDGDKYGISFSNSDNLLDLPIINNETIFYVDSLSFSDSNETMYMFDGDQPISSVSGDATVDGDTIFITGDCTIFFNVVED